LKLSISFTAAPPLHPQALLISDVVFGSFRSQVPWKFGGNILSCRLRCLLPWLVKIQIV
ncbi:hypothetical protein HAX54_002695, partial [Datura stramonium]|nr:hypothetical protein [Datura stramonium]